MRRGSNNSSLGAPATMYMAKPRLFDFEGAVAAAEAASDTPGPTRSPAKQEVDTKPKADAGETADDTDYGAADEPLSALERRQQHMATESIWRKRAREQMHHILRQPLTFRRRSSATQCPKDRPPVQPGDSGNASKARAVCVVPHRFITLQRLS